MTDIAKTIKPGQRMTVRATSATGTYTSLPLVEVKDGDSVIFTLEGSAPTPTPVPTGGNILGIDLAALPKSGTAYTRVKALAAKSVALNLSDRNAPYTEVILAKAIFGDKAGVLSMVRAAKTTLGPNSTCQSLGSCSNAASRSLAPVAVALSFVGAHEEDDWLKMARDKDYGDQGGALPYPGVSKRANNHGTSAELAVALIDLHLGDKAHLEQTVVPLFKTRTTEEALIPFTFESTQYQADPSKPIVIGRPGTTVNGVNADGLLPEEQRRATGFPNNGNYNWEASGQLLLEAWALRAAGYPAHTWGQSAIKRMFLAFKRLGFTPAGGGSDDWWQGHMVKALYGEQIIPLGVGDGKSFSCTDYLYG